MNWKKTVRRILLLTLILFFATVAFIPSRVEAQLIPYGVPKTLELPRVGIRATIEQVGIGRTGILQAPKKPNNVGWYKHGTIPGKPGNAFISGHLNTFTSTAVFWKLRNVRVGDLIIVKNDKKQTLTFKVTAKNIYPRIGAPLNDILGQSKLKRLNLMTCAGSWNSRLQNYSHRLVVYSQLVSIKSPK